mgnify:CR=1 FL=1
MKTATRVSPTSELLFSACPHDCPSTCALEVEKLDDFHIGRVRGARENSYTAGVICSKVARYAERIHHPDRLNTPLRRVGERGRRSSFKPVDWESALDEIAEALTKASQASGSESVWPYYYAGTMGLVMRDGINRLRHVKKYSGQYNTICTSLSYNGFIAGTGKLAGVDPREMSLSDVVVLWGSNAASTQVNVMAHVNRARRDRGAKIVVIDTYRNATARQADLFICVRPGTDGALACAVMHVLFRDGYANRAYLHSFSDRPRELESHLATKTPQWASSITGVATDTIEAFARLVGQTPRSFFRLGYGFARQRNGALNMHAALCIPVVTGAWLHEGGGAFHNNGDIFHWDKTLIEGLDEKDPSIRVLDQSRIGAILTGEANALKDGPAVRALFIQNTNPMMIAPDLSLVHEGFQRRDLFVGVHEQFMTETAKMADIVLPATMFLEHDDVYQGGGHQHIILGPKIIEPLAGCRTNHQVVGALAERLGANHQGFHMTPRELIDDTLRRSGWGSLSQLETNHWIDCQPDFQTSHYTNGFSHPDGKFRFSPDWSALQPQGFGPASFFQSIPELPDHWNVIEEATDAMPYRLVTAPARHYLNSSFTETPTSIRREDRPSVKIHPDDATDLGIGNHSKVRIGNERGDLLIRAEIFDGLQRGVVIVESIWPNHAFEEGIGINVLTGADPVGPVGGAAFHDNRVWIEAVEDNLDEMRNTTQPVN